MSELNRLCANPDCGAFLSDLDTKDPELVYDCEAKREVLLCATCAGLAADPSYYRYQPINDPQKEERAR